MILVPRLREILQYFAKWTMLACNILVRSLSPQVVSGVVHQPEMALHSPPRLHSRVTKVLGHPRFIQILPVGNSLFLPSRNSLGHVMKEEMHKTTLPKT